jgi:Zn-dependent protease
VGVQWYLLLMGLISMSLALFNLLPLLPLDGGHILVSLVEGVCGRALPQRVYERLSTLGITLIMFVTVIAFANDLGAAPHYRHSRRLGRSPPSDRGDLRAALPEPATVTYTGWIDAVLKTQKQLEGELV